MSKPKNPERLAEVEYCLASYFYANFHPVMKAKRNELQQAQAKEIADHQMSFAGLMSAFASASNPAGSLVDNSLYTLQITGEHCSKTAEDYVEMVKVAIANNPDFQHDLTLLAAEWREAIVADVGRERYDEVSAHLGTDLALAYVDYRIEQMIIDQMVSEQMPKSTADYIIRKGAENSLLGLPQSMLKSPLQAEIDARGEAAFNPSTAAKTGARGVSMAADMVMMGGVYSWGALSRWVGAEVVFAGLDNYLDGKEKAKTGLTVEQCISSALWGTEQNQLSEVRRDNWKLKSYEHPYLHYVNGTLTKKMPLLTEKPAWEIDFTKPFAMPGWDFTNSFPFSSGLGQWQTASSTFSSSQEGRVFNGESIPMPIAPGKEQDYLDWKQNQPSSSSRPDVPLVIAPGKEQEYLDWLAERQEEPQNQSVESTQPSTASYANAQSASFETQGSPSNQQGWAGLLGELGFNGLGDIGKNLGYVLAMLPDMLFGCFDGSTKSLGIKDNLLPLASILMGVFIKNPILKWLMIGLGGANLLNKVGHEALQRHESEPLQQKYKQYPDEPLNPRVSSPAISGNMLVATIDRVPCSISLPYSVIDAYNSGALPLNTLANAVLSRHDEQQALAQRNYREADLATDRTRQLNR